MVDVVCGVIYNSKNQILITQRGDEKFYGKWEFPGGKVEGDEDRFSSIKREIQEELGIIINPQKIIFQNSHDNFNLIFIQCLYVKGEITLNEHLSSKWINIEEINKEEFLEGDMKFIQKLKNY